MKKNKASVESPAIADEVKKSRVIIAKDQVEAKEKAKAGKITLITGNAGTGKTFVGCQALWELYEEKIIGRIILSRASIGLIDTKDIGAMPGDKREKMEGWIAPILDNFYKLIGNQQFERLYNKGDIAIWTLQQVRGLTIDGDGLLFDEFQNVTEEQGLAILTRLGKGGKLILTGDDAQIDTKMKSPISRVIGLCKTIKDIKHINLTTNHRDPIVDKIIKNYWK